MNFEWEQIQSLDDVRFYVGTYRAKVFGGWVVRNFDWTRQDRCSPESWMKHYSTSESMVFVPDPQHEWVID